MTRDKDTMVGSLVVAGAIMSFLTVALFMAGIWIDWRWAATAVIPGCLMAAAFKAAWILS